MSTYDHLDTELEAGWVLEGTDGDGHPIRLVFGETELARSYLGITVGRHPDLCDRVIDDPGISRRHMRLSPSEGNLRVEDLNSLNGTLVGNTDVPQFQPIPARPGQVIVLGRVTLTVSRLTDTITGR